MAKPTSVVADQRLRSSQLKAKLEVQAESAEPAEAVDVGVVGARGQRCSARFVVVVVATHEIIRYH